MIAPLIATLREHFGFTGFRPGQVEAIQYLMAGHHALVVMPTGAGKSLIFQLASLHFPGLTLVISPLIALMKDQVDSLTRRGISATYINSALPAGEQIRRLEDIAQGRYRLVYVAPERLRNVTFLEAIHKQQISLLAVDEAHCVSEWGYDFRPDYLHISATRNALNDPITVALTATATPKVQDDILRLLGIQDAQRVVTGFNRPNLFFEVRYTTDFTAKFQTLKEMYPCQGGGSIIYTGTRRDAEEIAEFLREVCNIRAEYYHAGLEAIERSRIQEAFVFGDLPVVAATNAFGMGIDRPDVRQVIHYTLPASLEAYYQEAGRAGRDDQPARVVLLYDPKDRALQEWFIDNSATTTNELRALFEALPPTKRSETWMSADDFSHLTGLPEVKVKVGLAQLEQSGAVEHLGDSGMRMLLRRGMWNHRSIKAAIAGVDAIKQNKKAHLDRMIAYAEANSCRRKILLEHFGDRSLTDEISCCDNCTSRQARPAGASDFSSLTTSQRIPLVILDTLRRLKTRVGREKLAQILKGSHAVDILKFHYDKSIYYGRLAGYSQGEIKDLIGQLVNMGYLKTIGGMYPVLSLTPKGETAIRDKTIIPLRLPRSISPEIAAIKRAEREAGGTVKYTAQLLAEGLNPAQIAQRRGLTQETIYNHLAQLIAAGQVPVDRVVPAKLRCEIEAVIEHVGKVDALGRLKILLPEEIDYGVIRCVVEDWKRNHLVIDYLSRSHPRPLHGPWSTGWALDFHSRFAGAEWIRSVSGELAYRLKYQGDPSALDPLIEQSLALLAIHPDLGQVDAIVPVPPSTPRPWDPATAFANALGERLKLEVLPALVKTRRTHLQKEIRTRAQKIANVSGAFAMERPVRGKRLLVVDDLFDSGATLEEITCLLLRAGATNVCVLTLTRTIHSDA